jgi:hypothetical protein
MAVDDLLAHMASAVETAHATGSRSVISLRLLIWA